MNKMNSTTKLQNKALVTVSTTFHTFLSPVVYRHQLLQFSRQGLCVPCVWLSSACVTHWFTSSTMHSSVWWPSAFSQTVLLNLLISCIHCLRHQVTNWTCLVVTCEPSFSHQFLQALLSVRPIWKLSAQLDFSLFFSHIHYHSFNITSWTCLSLVSLPSVTISFRFSCQSDLFESYLQISISVHSSVTYTAAGLTPQAEHIWCSLVSLLSVICCSRISCQSDMSRSYMHITQVQFTLQSHAVPGFTP